VSSCIANSRKEWIEGKRSGKLLVLSKEERPKFLEAFAKENLGLAKCFS